MPQRVLAPILHKDWYTRVVEAEVLAWMREAVFAPLLIELFNADVPVDPKYQAIRFDEEGRENAKSARPSRENAAATSAVRSALMSGRIHYADGKFTGRFSAAISKELRQFGATFNPAEATYSIPVQNIPLQLTDAIRESVDKSRHLHEDVISTLAEMELNIAASPLVLGVELSRAVDRVILDAGRQFVQTVATKGIGIQAEFTPAMRKQLTEQLTANLDLYVKDFTVEMVKDLRALVEENALKGMRSDKLAKIIESKFGVSKRKAEFLADQETGLLMAKYRQARYESLGSQEYIWSDSGDVRVRPDHHDLNGRRFSYANPPVVDKATGRRCNPGEDYRCRCVPRPIINLAAEVAA